MQGTERSFSRQSWLILLLFGLIGQIAWNVENMYFNVFIYKMFRATAADISAMVGASSLAATVTTLLIGALSDKLGKRKLFLCGGYLCWGISIWSFALLKAEKPAVDMIRTVYTLSNNKDTFTAEAVEPLTAKTHRKIVAGLEGMADGTYQFTYNIYSNSFTPVLLATGSLPVELVYNPLKLEINNPAYRNIIFSSMPDKKLTFTVKNEFSARCSNKFCV